MVNILKRGTFFLLALLFIAGNLLNYPFYRFAVDHAKTEMRKAVLGILTHDDKAGTIEMTISLQEYKNALVEDNEVKINGEMYDVVRAVNTIDGKIRLICLHDKQEGLIAVWMQKVTLGSTDAPVSSEKQGKTFKFTDGDEYLPCLSNSLPLVSGRSVIISDSFVSGGICAGYFNLVKLPPRVC